MNFMNLLKLPEAKQIYDLDSPLTVTIHKQIIQKKKFLKRLYLDFYKEFKSVAESVPKDPMVEIGSGGGFIKEVIPGVITSDLHPASGIDMVFSATEIPLDKNSISAFFLLDVLHHISDPIAFFHEVHRCLVEHGKIVMIEPCNSLWGRFIYKNFHHEPFDTNASWKSNLDGRLSGANIALPSIIFFRDRKKFEKEFPGLKIKNLTPHTPFRYLLSGGLSIRQLVPSCMYNIIKVFETVLSPLNKHLGMFLTIELEKTTS